MKADARIKSRVGIIIFASLVLFAVLVTVVGGKSGFFLRRVSYLARFVNTKGVVAGNQVRLSGVIVGAVQKIELPETPGESLTIHFDLERRYAHMVRSDSHVEIKTIGLLGDQYLELTPGSSEKPTLPPGSEIPASGGAGLEKLLAGSGDLMDNVVAISRSLKVILGRTEKGEGLIGEMTVDTPEGKALGSSLRQTLDNANLLIAEVRTGKGLLGKLVGDEKAASEIMGQLTQASGSLNRILGTVEKGTAEGKGALPALLSDPVSKEKVYRMLDSVNGAAQGLASFSKDLASGKGAIPRLVHDEEFANAFLKDLKSISAHLAVVAAKLDSSEGTAGKLINDTELHDALDDIVVGINESKMLRWLIRNRQKSGIKKRYVEEKAKAPVETGGE